MTEAPKFLMWSKVEIIPGISPTPSPFESLYEAGQIW